MKILCPTDLSAEGNNAVTFAAKLAQHSGSTLTLLNVQVLAELTPAEAIYGEAANVQNAQQVLDQFAKEVATTFKISCDALVYSSVSRLVSRIDKASQQFDVIVMGTDGPGSLAESVEGSKTYKLASWSRKPVIIVPFGVGYSEISRIVFAYNFRKNHNAPIKQLLTAARLTKAEVLCLQIIEETWTREIELEIEASQEHLRNIWPKDVGLRFHVVYADDHLESLKRYMTSADAELLAVAFNNQSWRETLLHRGTIRHLAEKATFPVLVVHE